MQRPTFITAQLTPAFRGKPTTIETPYLAVVSKPQKGTMVPTLAPAMICPICTNDKSKQDCAIKRTEMVYATNFYNGTHACYCREHNEAMETFYLQGSSENNLLGWVHDSASETGHVSVQISGAVEDDSHASTTFGPN